MFFLKKKRNQNIEVDYNNLPEHIGIIMDGNGRWAKKRGLPRSMGHAEGAKVLEKITRFAGDIGIRYITYYAFSTENWKRPSNEVEALMRLMVDYLDDYKRLLGGEDIRIRIIGKREGLSQEILDKIAIVEENTKHNSKITMNIAVNYGGREDIVNSMKLIADKVKKGELEPEDITEAHVSDNLYTNYMPDPDLIIRPSGELRLSNFLIWQSAYSEFWFSDINWPDFTKDDFLKAISDFQKETEDMEEFDMLKQRLLVGIIGGVLAIVVLCLGAELLSIALGIVSIVGLSEIYNATGLLKKQNKLCLASYVFSLLTFIIIAFVETPGIVLALLVFIYGAGLLIYGVFKHEESDFSSIGELFFQTLYVSVLFAHIVLVRKLPQGEFSIWIIFVTAWLSDTVAFAVGKKFGKNKLLPEISPKKTVEGAVGGLAGSVIFNLILGIVCSVAFKLNVNYLALFFVSIVAGVMSQLGDLAASSIKREYGIKDFSKLLPGHGGMLDRFDSVLFVAPTVYYFVVIFSVFA